MKKLLSLFFMAFIPIVMMAYDCKVDGICYNLVVKAHTASVTKASYYNVEYKGDVVIPATFEYDGATYTVTGIGDEAFRTVAYTNEMTSISIPNTVTSIGNSAFYDCTGLTSIDIPNSVTSIGNSAFYDCTGLTSVTIPNSVTSIGRGAFGSCTSLTSIDIPNGVTSIGDGAFDSCTSLTSIDIPNSVTSIGRGAFEHCIGLTSITVNPGNTKYDSRNNCNAIIEKSSNTLISGCKNTIIPNTVTSIGNSAFCNCTGLTSIDIPDAVTSIGDQAFSNCTSLTSIDIPDGVTEIGYRTFAVCTSLTSINIGNNVTKIDIDAFTNCSSLTSIIIPDAVTSIGQKAFSNCASLTSVEIGNGVTMIGSETFTNCVYLTYVICKATSVPSTNTNAFNGSDVEYATLIVPDASLSAYQSTAPWSNFGTILASSQATVVTANSYTREYGDANPNPFEYTSAVTLNGTPFITCAADATSAPGTYPITISQGTVTNTGLVFVDGTLTVTKAPLTIAVNSYTIYEGDALPSYDAVFTGLKNNESESVVNPVVSCTALDSNTPGTYDINVTATSDNYDITIVKGTLTILPTKMSITISDVGVATYCSAYDLDFSTVTDFKAYIATGYNSATGNVIVQAVKDAPAGTGLFLKGTPGTYDVPCGESSSYYVNMLVGATEAITIQATEGSMTNFVLYATNSSDACFKPLVSTYNLKANRAYLQIPTNRVSSSAGANAVGIEFEEGVTGIDNRLSDMDANANWFTLDGRKLNGKPTQKGIYVVNGQKVVIK